MCNKEKRPSAMDRHQKDTNSITILAAFVAAVLLLWLANVGVA